ncbi:PIG-L family deacetylase [Mycobacterium sp.]|uniref:PIG-L family deacetylase n=1 Tax=Mycobacterium sp. TaxID=1785 RepID=UPI0025E8F987|nr:PIG-L family deacetylase [Mycobacterium sp.]
MTHARPFTHDEPGTDESTWLLDARWDSVARLARDTVPRRYPHVMVIAPHPNDETLALGTTLADLAGGAATVTVIITTYGGGGAGSTERRVEGERALSALGDHILTHWWDFPDGALGGATDAIIDRLSDRIGAHFLLLAPVECDGHSDHEAVSVAAEVCAREGRCAALLLYPVWLWHWATPDDVDFARQRTTAPSLPAMSAKDSALNCYVSQLNSADGSPVIGPALRTRARRVIETVLIPLPADLAARVDGHIAKPRSRAEIAQSFDPMLNDGVTDPWRLDASEYEKRRLAQTLARLGRPRYHRVLEIGCSTGQLAERLRAHADYAVGLDASDRALDAARAHRRGALDCRHSAGGHTARTVRPHRVSEVTYFLNGPDLYATLRAVRRRLRPRGEILIANYAAPTQDTPLDGPTVHRQAEAVLDLPMRARYQDADLTIQAWGEPRSLHQEYGGVS